MLYFRFANEKVREEDDDHRISRPKTHAIEIF